MASIGYQYNIESDFTNGLSVDRFLSEIKAEPQITISLDGERVDVIDGICSVWFKDALPSTPIDQKDVLDQLVEGHSGEPLKIFIPQEVILHGTPKESDGRVNVVNAPMSHGMYSWWTGSGDLTPEEVPPEAGPVSGRGMGQKMNLTFSAGEGEEHSAVIDFTSYVEIYDGEGVWEPVMYWGVEDRFWVYVLVPANYGACTVVSGTGNANVVDTGQGFSMVVPAAGDGQYNINYDEVAPLEVGEGNPMAYWDIPDFTVGTVTPAVGEGGSAAGKFALLYELGWRVYVCNDMPMGSPRGVFLVDSDKSEAVHKNWKLVVKCVKHSKNGGNMGVWLKFFRPDTSEPDYPPTTNC